MTPDTRLLVVDDEPAQRQLLAGFLRGLGAEVHEAANGTEALAAVSRLLPDVVLTDFRMPGMAGDALLGEIRRCNPELRVVVVTAFGTVADAVTCLKAGADDYLLKPLDLDQVEHVVRRAVERRQLERENRELRRRLNKIESLPGIVTAGGSMSEVLSTISRAAASPAPVLVLGESGTGKELVARAIHAASRRAGGPFVAVNGASLSATLVESELFGHERGAFTGAERSRLGRFELAADGTLFLDEVGDLPAETQIKLLRVLQEGTIERVGASVPRSVDVRIVAATHRDLPARVADGRFREDLYYRLAVVVVELPPLRRRRADIPLLVEHFLTKHRAAGYPDRRFSREALDRLLFYDYPGNVRELENIVQRSLVLARGTLIRAGELPPSLLGRCEATMDAWRDERRPLDERVSAMESDAILAALGEANGNQSRAAANLGLSERVLRYKLDKYELRQRC